MKHLLVTFFLFFTVILISCGTKTNEIINTYTSAEPGTMIGYVVIHDSTGQNTDNSGVKISIDGTNYSTLSDSIGKWELDNVIPGTYNISFTKDTYATEKTIAYRFVGNGKDFLFTQNIYQMIWTRVSFVIRAFDSGKAVFSCRIFRNDSTKSLGGTVMLLFGKQPSLSPETPASYLYETDNYHYQYQGNIPDNTTGYSFTIDSSVLVKAGFQPNESIYCEAFV